MKQAIPSALISIDPEFREAFLQATTRARQDIFLGVDINVPFLDISEAHLKQLKEVRPELIFLDVEHDPEVGINFAQYLADEQPSRRFVAAGPVLPPELLMAAMRAGITEYLTKPATPEALAEAIERTGRRFSTTVETQESGKVFTFLSARGGSGSTTLATNLAIHLHKLTGKRTLLVDLDVELGEVALFLRVQPRFNVVDLARNLHRMDAELLTSYIERHASGVHLLAAPYHPEKNETVSGEQARAMLAFLKEHYHYVVVDTARSFSPLTQAALQQADQLFLVSHMDLPSLRNIKRCLPLVERLGGTLEKVHLVVNRHSDAAEITPEEVKRTIGLEVYWKLADDFEHVMHAVNSGEPLALNGNGSPFARDLRAFGAALAGVTTDNGGRRKPLEAVRQLFRRATFEKEGASHE